jgi:peptidoglycan/xylan/chitin deacetylase (PgdA/CDA1 family)
MPDRRVVLFHPRRLLPRLALTAAALIAGCRTTVPPEPSKDTAPCIRFLLTFDDGPSIRTDPNPTLSILDQFATNDLQPGIKGIFFVQTGHPRGGGTPRGREIMRRMAAAGQVLGIHSTSPRRHIDHTRIATNALAGELSQAKALLGGICGAAPLFLRPPFGAMDPRTRRIYDGQGLHVLMTDIRARDGVIYGYNGSLTRRWHIRRSLEEIRNAWPPSPTGEPLPVVVGFHDVNPYTARHMTEYLHILVEEARRTGFDLPPRPFYDDRRELLDAAITRRVPPPGP